MRLFSIFRKVSLKRVLLTSQNTIQNSVQSAIHDLNDSDATMVRIEAAEAEIDS